MHAFKIKHLQWTPISAVHL